MTYADLIKQIAEQTELKQKDVKAVLESAAETIVAEVAAGNKFGWPQLGTFKLSARKARTGRNPRDGSKIEIAAAKALKFSAATSANAAVNA